MLKIKKIIGAMLHIQMTLWKDFMKFEKMKAVLKFSLFVHSIRISKFSYSPYYEPLAWFMILLWKYFTKEFHSYCNN